MTTPTEPITEDPPVHPRRRRGKRSAERVILHDAFNAWLQQPQIEARYCLLTAAMREHELRERLRKLLPEPVPTEPPAVPQGLHGLQGIPVQEVTFTNPDHRSTRLEFLADATHYGA